LSKNRKVHGYELTAAVADIIAKIFSFKEWSFEMSDYDFEYLLDERATSQKSESTKRLRFRRLKKHHLELVGAVVSGLEGASNSDDEFEAYLDIFVHITALLEQGKIDLDDLLQLADVGPLSTH
jgi:hypothetical protein